MNSINSPYEFTVVQKVEGRLKARRVLLVMVYIIYVLLFSLLILTFLRGLVPVMALIPITLYIIILITWRSTQKEFEYETVSGSVTFATIYGAKQRKERISFNIRDCCKIAPLTSEQSVRLKAEYSKKETVYALSSLTTPDAYFAEINNPGAKKAVVLFDATNRFLKICKFYNPSATEVTQVRY